MKNYTEKKKADRQKMAEIMHALAIECGATAEIIDQPFGHMSPRMVAVEIEAPRGLRLTAEFDGESVQPDTFVNAWHMSTRCDTCLSDAFPGSVNGAHFRKSTTVSYGFKALCDHVRQVLTMAADGTAFDEERERAKVAKNGTWQESQARFDAWAAELQANKESANVG